MTILTFLHVHIPPKFAWYYIFQKYLSYNDKSLFFGKLDLNSFMVFYDHFFCFHFLQNDQKEATQINRPKTLKQIRYCFVCSQKYCIMFLPNRQLPSKTLPKNFDAKQQEFISYLTQLKTALNFMQILKTWHWSTIHIIVLLFKYSWSNHMKK